MSQTIRRYSLTGAIALAVFVLGYRRGSYGELQRAETAAIACLAVVALLAGGARLARPLPFVVLGGLLAGLTAWTALSLTWAPSADDAFPQVILLAVYLGVFCLVALTARRRALSIWCDGMAIGIAAVGCVALLSRFFPGLFEASRPQVDLLASSASRLSFPVGYWNGLAIFLACGVPLFLRSAISLSAGVARQVLSVGVLPVIGTVTYLASSRGAALTAGVAVVAYVALSGSRWACAGAAAVLGLAGSAVAVALTTSEPSLVNAPFDGARPLRFAGVLLICVITGVAFAVLNIAVLGWWEPGRRTALAVTVGLVVVALAALTAVDARARFDAFKASPVTPGAAPGSLRSHFLSSGSSGRWQLWTSALDEFRSAPLAGRGAGSYESWWAEHGSLPIFVRNAHSLYLETLAELGVVGLLLLAGFLLGGLGLALRMVIRTTPRFRYQPAAPAAVVAGMAVAAGLDWIWQLPAIGVVAVACVALLAGAAAEGTDEPVDGPRPTAWRTVAIATGVVMVPLVLVAAVDAATQLRLRESERAAARNDGAAAIAEAQAARALEPWSAAPALRVALAEERFGSLPVARAAIDEAVRKDAADWRLRLIAARLQAKVGDIEAASRSLDAARSLNPRSPLFAGAG